MVKLELSLQEMAMDELREEVGGRAAVSLSIFLTSRANC